MPANRSAKHVPVNTLGSVVGGNEDVGVVVIPTTLARIGSVITREGVGAGFAVIPATCVTFRL